MKDLIARDRSHVWHPYSSVVNPPPVFEVISADGVRLKLADGRELIDGMSSWWTAIHGYNVPELNAAATAQLAQMSHVMFGGLTHAPAVDLAETLVKIAPAGLETVFFSDSGSVAVEVALKLAIQYWAARGETKKQRILTVRGGYHGDTVGAMSVCDPITGMHTLFQEILPRQLFAPRPQIRYGATWDPSDLDALTLLLADHANELAAIIIEPIVQGAGGMWFYHAEYLREVRRLCTAFNVLLIADEIATGFGRTGHLFGCDHSQVAPDIMCVGKALTGGYMSLAATLTTREIAVTISSNAPGVFMHGPTFMGNPLACRIAGASVDLLLSGPWHARVQAIEAGLRHGLAECAELKQVADVRILGAIGVVELHRAVDMQTIPQSFVHHGVWIRPFGKLVYVMPPYIINREDLARVTKAIVEIVSALPH